jgi:hypothetical protein
VIDETRQGMDEYIHTLLYANNFFILADTETCSLCPRLCRLSRYDRTLREKIVPLFEQYHTRPNDVHPFDGAQPKIEELTIFAFSGRVRLCHVKVKQRHVPPAISEQIEKLADREATRRFCGDPRTGQSPHLHSLLAVLMARSPHQKFVGAIEDPLTVA